MSTSKTGNVRGREAEDLACRFLRKRGARILERNYRCRLGEIDIIAQWADYLVFVEVRYRRSSRYGSGAETVTRRKQERVIRTAQFYLGSRSAARDKPARFDVISITARGSEHEIQWIPDAFSAQW